VIRLGAAVLGAAVLSGCAYYNTLYNSELLFEEAEAHRRAGRDSLAELRYRDVIRKTSESYRGRPSGEGVAETLFLLGRAQLHVGQPREAHAALAQAESLAREPGLRSRILVQQGWAASHLGAEDEARRHLEEAFEGGLSGRTLANAYLLRGRLRLQSGSTAEGWDDLERAGGADPAVAAEASVERLRWGVRHRDLERARSALGRLLLDPDAAELRDTISALVSAAAERWSPSVAATMLGDVDSAPWDRTARAELALQRGELLRSAGDIAGGEEQAWRIARGRGETVADARLLLARWHLEETRDLGDAQAVLPIVLPVADDPRAAELVDAVDDLERFSGIGLDEPLGWFAAAEIARDRLGAPILARGLFLAYADTDPTDPWAPKALLAALSVSSDELDRSWLRGRLEAHPNSPYVLAARGGSAADFEALEEDLRARLSEIATR
jgi:tetratricopeptide (TPR) repeat protein